MKNIFTTLLVALVAFSGCAKFLDKNDCYYEDYVRKFVPEVVGADGSIDVVEGSLSENTAVVKLSLSSQMKGVGANVNNPSDDYIYTYNIVRDIDGDGVNERYLAGCMIVVKPEGSKVDYAQVYEDYINNTDSGVKRVNCFNKTTGSTYTWNTTLSTNVSAIECQNESGNIWIVKLPECCIVPFVVFPDNRLVFGNEYPVASEWKCSVKPISGVSASSISSYFDGSDLQAKIKLVLQDYNPGLGMEIGVAYYENGKLVNRYPLGDKFTSVSSSGREFESNYIPISKSCLTLNYSNYTVKASSCYFRTYYKLNNVYYYTSQEYLYPTIDYCQKPSVKHSNLKVTGTSEISESGWDRKTSYEFDLTVTGALFMNNPFMNHIGNWTNDTEESCVIADGVTKGSYYVRWTSTASDRTNYTRYGWTEQNSTRYYSSNAISYIYRSGQISLAIVTNVTSSSAPTVSYAGSSYAPVSNKVTYNNQ